MRTEGGWLVRTEGGWLVRTENRGWMVGVDGW